MKKIIWSSEVNLEDYKEYFEEEGMEDVDDYKKMEIAQSFSDMHLQELIKELDIDLDGRILVIADLGTWRGRFNGYKILNGRKLSDIFHSTEDDHMTWYYDGYNIRGKGIHHDGTNYYEFREIREDRDISRFTSMIYNDEIYGRDKVNYYTRSLRSKIKEAMGW
jgi:hypothetical protein